MESVLPKARWAVAVATMLVLPTFLHAQQAPEEEPDDEAYTDESYSSVVRGLETLGEAFREIATRYVVSIDATELVDAAIEGMVGTLDPYSSYVPSSQAYSQISHGRPFSGVGIELENVDGYATVVDVIDGTAARSAGIRIGDRLIAVDDTSLVSIPMAAQNGQILLRGTLRTQVGLTLVRDGSGDTIRLTLERERITPKSVSYASVLDSGILYVRLDRFGETAGNEARAELRWLLRHHDDVRGVVLDLRDNPGGVLDEGVSVAESFVPEDSVIVSTWGRDPFEIQVYRSQRNPIVTDVPIVVLVNGGTASAAEIVAGAIQDHDLGIVAGTPSLGKGLVQSVTPLPYDATLRLTTAWYATPSGRSIHNFDSAFTYSLLFGEDGRGPFTSGSGRPLPEGLGIVPDTVLLPRDSSALLPRLESEGLFFQFVSREIAMWDSLPANFTIDNTTLSRFEAFVLGTQRDDRIDEAIEAIGSEGGRREYDEAFRTTLANLEKELARNEERLLQRHREEVRERLRAEFVSRFTDHAGRVELALARDPQAQGAIALARDRGRYERLLAKGSITPHHERRRAEEETRR